MPYVRKSIEQIQDDLNDDSKVTTALAEYVHCLEHGMNRESAGRQLLDVIYARYVANACTPVETGCDGDDVFDGRAS